MCTGLKMLPGLFFNEIMHDLHFVTYARPGFVAELHCQTENCYLKSDVYLFCTYTVVSTSSIYSLLNKDSSMYDCDVRVTRVDKNNSSHTETHNACGLPITRNHVIMVLHFQVHFLWYFMVPGWCFMVFKVPGRFLWFQGSRLVAHGSKLVVMVFHSFSSVFHGSRTVFIVFSSYRLLFLGFQVGFL